MAQWGSAKAGRVLAALLRLGWRAKRQTGSHRTLERTGWPDYVWAFHDGTEIPREAEQRLQRERCLIGCAQLESSIRTSTLDLLSGA